MATIDKVAILKKTLVDQMSRYYNETLNPDHMVMTYIPPRKGYVYGIQLKHNVKKTLLRFYLTKSYVFFLNPPIMMLTKPKVVGIGDETLVFIGTIALDIPNLDLLLTHS
jgi:hypothetical protein